MQNDIFTDGRPAAEPISGPARDHGVMENLFAGTTPAPATQSQITTTYVSSKVQSIWESAETCNSNPPDPINKVEISFLNSWHLLKLLSLDPH